MEAIPYLTDEQCKRLYDYMEAEFPELWEPDDDEEEVELDPELWYTDENGDEWWIGPRDEKEAAELLGFSFDEDDTYQENDDSISQLGFSYHLIEKDGKLVGSLNNGNISTIERFEEEETQEKEED